MRRYGPMDIGCYADGTFGHAYVRDRLYDLVRWQAAPRDILQPFVEEPSDDGGEEYNALDWLNDHCCTGVYFEFYEGDLMLRPLEDSNDD